MSRRSSVYYEDGGVHIFYDRGSRHPGMWLEYSEGSFEVTMPLSVRLSALIQFGLAEGKKKLDKAPGAKL